MADIRQNPSFKNRRAQKLITLTLSIYACSDFLRWAVEKVDGRCLNVRVRRARSPGTKTTVGLLMIMFGCTKNQPVSQLIIKQRVGVAAFFQVFYSDTL